MPSVGEVQFESSRLRHGGRRAWTLVAVSLTLVVVSVGALALSRGGSGSHAALRVGSPGETFGTMPNTGNRTADYANAPDFISVLSPTGDSIAGYARKTDLYALVQGRLFLRNLDGLKVYAADGLTLVGHMYSGKGFVALSDDPNAVPTRTSVSLFEAPTTVSAGG